MTALPSVLAGVLLLAAVPARAETPPSAAEPAPRASPRKRHSQGPKARPKRHGRTAPATKAAPGVRRLAPGRWRPEVADALERLLEQEGAGREDYSDADPPVAVFGWEDVSITHRLGEAVFRRLVTRADFKFSEEFWGEVPEVYGRARLRSDYESFRDHAQASWPKEPAYRSYRKGFLRCYQRMCAAEGAKSCARWLTVLLKGFSQDELRNYSTETIRQEFLRPVGEELAVDDIDDPAPVKMPVGLRRIPEMADLYRRLLDRGFDVWVLSGSNDWSLKTMAAMYGVDGSRAVGVRCKVVNDKLTADVLIPIPVGSGQAEALTLFVGRPPSLVVASSGDSELLGYGRGVRIAVADAGAGGAVWERKGWLYQPRFSPVRPPQEFQ